MQMGFENKRQAWLLISLATLLVSIASWELYGNLSTHAAVAGSAPASVNPLADHSRGQSAAIASEPRLRTGQLARAENTQYSSGGRNIFSLESEPVAIEAPIAPARPAEVAVAPPPGPPLLPPIELKYIGYTRNVGDTAYKAVLAHNDESLIARAGETVFHRYKVISVQPGTIQVTDLSNRITQNLPIIEK